MAAQSPSPILGAQAFVIYAVPVDALLANTTLEGNGLDPTQGDEQGLCGSDHLETMPDESRFRFSESSFQTGCGEYGYPFTMPPWATSFTLYFTADRTIGQPQNTRLPTDAEQSVRLYTPEGVVAVVHYFDSVLGSQAPMPHLVPLEVPRGVSEVNVTWFFSERGFSPTGLPASVGSGHAFAANVTFPRIAFPPLEQGRGTVVAVEEEDRSGLRHTNTTYALEIPELRRIENDTLSFAVRLDENAALMRVTAPDGRDVPTAALPRQELVSAVELRLDEAFLATYGTGTYGFTFHSAAALPPPPPPAPPTTFYPLAYLLLSLPIMPGAVAWREGYALRRRATGSFQVSARNVLVAFGAVAALYLALAGYTLLARRVSALATMPLAFEGWFLLAQLLIIFGAFVVLAIYPRTYLSRALESDLERRKRVQDELERSNKELEQFAYVASHDLQEPLRTISGYTQLLSKRYDDRLDDKGRRYIERTVAGTERMQRLINDLLAYSRVQTRGGDFVAVDMNEVAARVGEDLERAIGEANARVHVDPLPTIVADPLQMQQVLINLMRNAVKYRHPDRDPVVFVSAREEETEWHFIVQDNGTGIPEDQFERIFIIFQRLVPRESDDTGTGIGLAIAQRIVERHGGRIWVESVVGTGSTFHFTVKKHGEKR